jgi:hypothetical protein
LAFNGFSIVPENYGARALSLGYASTGFNYDINAIFLNPALVTSNQFPLSGYQYQNSYLDYKGFEEKLNDVLGYGLANYESLSSQDKSEVFNLLKDMYNGKTGMYGFQSSIPGYVARGYGLSVSLVDTAVINPVDTAGDSMTDGLDFFEKTADEITNGDIAGLQMNFLGLKYKKISLAYGMQVARSMNIGVTVHYLYGKVNDFNRSLLDNVFQQDTTVRDYLKTGWQDPEEKFSKIVADVGVTAMLGRYFTAGLVMRNFGSAKIKTLEREIQLPKRIIAGLAFRPKADWGFYVDMDVAKTDLLFNGKDVQPISIGIEKGFFKNKFFLRAGMLNDIREDKFFGKDSSALYGMGVGFNMGKIIVDLALGLNNDGKIKNLAVSGFIVVK